MSNSTKTTTTNTKQTATLHIDVRDPSRGTAYDEVCKNAENCEKCRAFVDHLNR
jgi:hypothetical protein